MTVFLVGAAILLVGMMYIGSFLFNMYYIGKLKRSLLRMLIAVVCIIPPINFVFSAYWIAILVHKKNSGSPASR